MKSSMEKSREPQNTKEYLLPEYWDQRFKEEEKYEWCKDYSSFRHLVHPHLKSTDKILILGCGNSRLTAELWKDGFKSITSIDLSQVVIEKMAEKAHAEGMNSLKWLAADMLALPFKENDFDAVLEKGTLDVLFVDNDSPWDPKPEVCSRFHHALREVHRVLKQEGKFISITFAQPHFRRTFLTAKEYNWSVQHSSFGDSFHYFVYVMKKGQQNNPESNQLHYNPAAFAGKEGSNHDHMEQEDYLMHMDLT